MSPEALQQTLAEMRQEADKVLVGLQEPFEQLTIALLTGGHVLLEGVPGTAKTLMAKTLAHLVQAQFRRIQFTPDLMPSDILGTSVFNMATGDFNLKKGPIFTQILLADEINRAPAKTQSALLEAMEERQINLEGERHELARPFMVIATQNPIEYEGTYPLPEAQLDRFLFKVVVEHAPPEVEVEVLRRYSMGFNAHELAQTGLRPLLSAEFIAEARATIERITVEEGILHYIARITAASRRSPDLLLGASTRAATHILLSAKTFAALQGRDFVVPDDVKYVVPPICRHRFILKPEAEIEGLDADAVTRRLLGQVEVPPLMMLTLRGGLMLAVVAPLWAADWPWLAGGYLLLCTAVLAADFWRAGPIGRFELSRTHDDKLSLGAENHIHLAVRQSGRQPRRIWVRDEPPEAFIISQRIHEGWVAGLQSWQASYTVRPLRRGDYAFGDLHLRWLGPLGLLVRQAAVPAAHPVKVYPNLYEVRRYDLLLRQNRLQELGLRHTRLFGQGSEFERLREYQPDDDFRRINWKATARRHRPMTVEYQTERSQNIMAVLDIGRMMQSPVADMAKLDYAINAVLLLGYVATGMGDKIGLMTFADEVVNFLSPAQGKKQFYKMLETLYRIAPEPVEPHYGGALSYLGTKQRKRALLLIFTDLSGGSSMDDLLRYAVRLARHSLPVVVTISDPDIGAVAKQRPTDSLGVYQQTAAQQLLDERRIALETLERQGVLTLDVPANQLSIAVINRYLELKGQMRL